MYYKGPHQQFYYIMAPLYLQFNNANVCLIYICFMKCISAYTNIQQGTNESQIHKHQLNNTFTDFSSFHLKILFSVKISNTAVGRRNGDGTSVASQSTISEK